MTTKQVIEQIQAILDGLEGSDVPEHILIRQTLWSLQGVLYGHPTVKAIWMEGVDQINRFAVEFYQSIK